MARGMSRRTITPRDILALLPSAAMSVLAACFMGMERSWAAGVGVFALLAAVAIWMWRRRLDRERGG
jgi:MYXO-CTERM domain-containing protein